MEAIKIEYINKKKYGYRIISSIGEYDTPYIKVKLRIKDKKKAEKRNIFYIKEYLNTGNVRKRKDLRSFLVSCYLCGDYFPPRKINLVGTCSKHKEN